MEKVQCSEESVGGCEKQKGRWRGGGETGVRRQSRGASEKTERDRIEEVETESRIMKAPSLFTGT